ncbi:hypothetical protein ACS5NO_32135 [Larkinella sp. GY13]|uniref:hypothetical protein n=1 Tax=Larkinella sp. GY13 TaxID=3453720 RepID=UPI003EEA7447
MKPEQEQKIRDYEMDLFWKKKELEGYQNDLNYDLIHQTNREINDIKNNIDDIRIKAQHETEKYKPVSWTLRIIQLIVLIFLFWFFKNLLTEDTGYKEPHDPTIATTEPGIVKQLEQDYREFCTEANHGGTRHKFLKIEFLSVRKSYIDTDTYEVDLRINDNVRDNRYVNDDFYDYSSREKTWQNFVSFRRVQRLAEYNKKVILVHQFQSGQDTSEPIVTATIQGK